MNPTSETLIALGGPIKSFGNGKIGGYLVSFGSPDRRDFHKQYFKSTTYYGARQGDGMDVLVHHGIPLKSGLEGLADRILPAMNTKVDTIGIWAETVLDLSDEYQQAVYDMVEKGKLKWSSGSASHMVKVDSDGGIDRWPIIEGSLTPTPAEWRETNTLMPIKAYQAAIESTPTVNQAAIKADLLGEHTESRMTVAALESLFCRLQWGVGDILMGWTTPPITDQAEQRAVIEAMLVEFIGIFSRYMDAVLGGTSTETVEIAAKAMKAAAVKAAAVLSKQNYADLKAASDLIVAVIDRHDTNSAKGSSSAGEDEPVKGSAELEALVKSLQQQVTELQQKGNVQPSAAQPDGAQPPAAQPPAGKATTTPPKPIPSTAFSQALRAAKVQG